VKCGPKVSCASVEAVGGCYINIHEFPRHALELLILVYAPRFSGHALELIFAPHFTVHLVQKGERAKLPRFVAADSSSCSYVLVFVLEKIQDINEKIFHKCATLIG